MGAKNVVVILTDDHARWANGCYGNSEIETPSIEHLARTGVVFENAFCPTPVCSPARASFWTGRLPSQHGVHDYLGDSVSATNWLENETNLAELFSAAGYNTGLVGKWHLGGGGKPARGFDYWAQSDVTKAMAEAFSLFKGGRVIDTESSRGYKNPRGARPSRSIDDSTHRIIDDAVQFINERDERPFFLYVGFLGTHSPWAGHPERLVQRYRRCSFDDIPNDTVTRFGSMSDESLLHSRRNPREALAQYYAAVTQLDEQVGRLLDELSDHGVLDDTLIVYTSDHGLNLGHHGFWGKGNGTRPLNMFEESIRIPLVVSQPGKDLYRGTRRSESVTHCDTFRMILDWAGLGPDPTFVEKRNLPGRSYLPLLNGGCISDWPDSVFGEYGDVRMVRTLRYKLVHRSRSNCFELFDLASDGRETVNLADDPANKALVDQLRQQIDKYFANYDEAPRSGLTVSSRPDPNAWPAWVDISPF